MLEGVVELCIALLTASEHSPNRATFEFKKVEISNQPSPNMFLTAPDTINFNMGRFSVLLLIVVTLTMISEASSAPNAHEAFV